MYHPIIDRLKRIAELLPTSIGGEFIPSGTKQISITQNGTTLEDVTQYANAEISVNVPSVSVTDGIVVNSRDSSGRATNIDFYGNVVNIQQFYNYTKNNGAWISLASITFKDTVTEIKNNGFRCCGLLSALPETVEIINTNGCEQTGVVALSLPNLTTLQGGSTFLTCTNLQSFVAPKLTSIQGNYNFGACSALQNVQIGSVGYGLTNIPSNTFSQVTQTGLTITVYTSGTYVDAILSNIRNSATNATIIIKASETTTYNNVSYNAGDTIVTSEVTP